MQINKIILTNFGSYEGINAIETNISKTKNIVLFGGANGAGKTTLFKSIGLCLYGYTSLGYASQSNKYTKIIKNLINYKEKQNDPAKMSIELEITMENGQDVDDYILKRAWTFSDDLTEKFEVIKNNSVLSNQEIADFEKYLLSIIPPEMFNLYFFDGEKIADFFTDQDGNKRLKDAFLTICGYDTFDIMSKNFKRINQKEKQSSEFNNYIEAKLQNEENKEKLNTCKKNIEEIIERLKDCDAELDLIEKKFTTSGGITEKEWNSKEEEIKKEELKREQINFELKQIANDTLPFVMIKKQIEDLKKSIIQNNENEKIKYFIEIIESDIYKQYFSKNTKLKKDILKIINNIYTDNDRTLDLSYEQELNVLSQINRILLFNTNSIYDLKNNLQKSLKKTLVMHKEMNKLTSSNSSDYIETKKKLLDEKNVLITKRSQYEEDYSTYYCNFNESNLNLDKYKNIVENEIKQQSINDISVKAIIMLDKLQESLYKEKIDLLESNLRKNLSLMMSKDHLITEVMIDDDFNLHIYQNEKLTYKEFINFVKNGTQIRSIFPKYIEDFKNNSKIKNKKTKNLLVPMEIEISSLSAGERQMLILSLYLSLVELGNVKIPFVIDTPFARMDKTHRINISKYFFSSLKGQVFVLSTNKEIDKEHIEIIGKKVSKKYTLLNSEGSKTTVISDKYF